MSEAEDVDTYFANIADPSVGDLAQAIRARLDALGPGLAVKLAWGFPCWIGNERIASVIAHKSHANLKLWSGARLADAFPSRIEGGGKQLRHVKIRAPAEIDETLDAIIDAAIRLDREAPEAVR